MIALLILTTYFPLLERGARPSPTLGSHVFQTTALSVLKVPYAQETTTALLRSHSCFPNRLVIQNEDIILSNDYIKKKGFWRKSKKKKILTTVQLRPFLAAGHIFYFYLLCCSSKLAIVKIIRAGKILIYSNLGKSLSCPAQVAFKLI